MIFSIAFSFGFNFFKNRNIWKVHNKSFEILSKKSFPSGSAETGAEDFFDYFLQYFFSGLASRAGLVGSRQPLYVAQFRYAPDF